MSKKLIALLSEITGNEDLSAETVVVEAETPVSLSSDQVVELEQDLELAELKKEVAAQSEEIENLEEKIEETEEVVEELADVVEGVEALLKQPSLDRVSIALLYNRADKLNVKLCGKSHQVIDGNEAFSDDQVLRTHVVAGLEGFMETLKKAGAAAADMIKRIYYLLLDFVKSFFDRAPALKKKAEAVARQIGSSTFKDKVNLGGWNRYFKDNNVTGSDGLYEALSQGVETLGKYIESLKNPDNVAENLTEEKLIENTLKIFKDLGSSISKNSNSMIMWNTAESFNTAGGIWLKYYGMGDDDAETFESFIKELKKVKFSFTNNAYVAEAGGENPFQTSGEVPAFLTKDQAKQVIASVHADVKRILTLSEQVKQRKAVIDQITKLIPEAKATEPEAVAKRKKVVELIQVLVTKYSNIVKTISEAQVSIGEAKLSAVKAHFA